MPHFSTSHSRDPSFPKCVPDVYKKKIKACFEFPGQISNHFIKRVSQVNLCRSAEISSLFTLTRREFTFNEEVTTGLGSTFTHNNHINRKATNAKFSMEKKLLMTALILQTVTTVYNR